MRSRFLLLLIIVLIGLDLLWGVWGELSESVLKVIVFQLRLPRIVNGILAGASLGLVGLLLQRLFDNPLAGPYILGVSSGAALGVALSMLWVSAVGLGFWVVSLFSWVGALGVVLIILYLAMRYPLSMVIIAGILITALFNAIISSLQFLAPADRVKSFVLWTMASIDVPLSVGQLVFFLAIGISFWWIIRYSQDLDALYLGEDYAGSLGVDMVKLKIVLLLISSCLVAFSTALYGPVAFVGVISPHLARLVNRAYEHNALAWYTVLWGVLMMLAADFFSHLFVINLPLNTSLSLLGLPVLFYILLSRKVLVL